MLPRLFDFQDIIRDYSNNLSNVQNQLGKGYFTQIKNGEVKEVLNGEYTLKLDIMQNDKLAKSVEPGSCILAKPNFIDDPQVFVVTSLNYADDGVLNINGEHIKSMFFNNVVMGNNTQESVILEGTPSQIVSGLLNEVLATNYFTFTSNISTSKRVKRKGTLLTLGEIFSDSERGMITRFKGELKYNNFNVSFLSKRGNIAAENKNADVFVRYGSKISSFKQEMSTDGTYSHVLPYATVDTSDGYHGQQYEYNGTIKSVTLYGREENTSNYLIPTGSGFDFTKIYPLDLSKEFTDKHGYVNPNNGAGYADTEELIYSLGVDYVTDHMSLGKPSVNVSVDYQTALDELSKVNLGDSVTVVYDPIGYVKNHRVSETAFDFVNEQYNSVTIGDRNYSLYDYIKQLRR